MKRLFLFSALLGGLMFARPAAAQVHIGVHLNIGSQPEWGPVGYDYVNYYYLPDVDAYYDVPAHCYVYQDGGVWVRRTYLPGRYRNYDIYNGYKVVVNRPSPWLRNTYYRNAYSGYRGRGGQVIIRDSRDQRYREHWKGDNGRHNGWNRPGNPHGEDHGHGGGDHGHGGGDHGHGGGEHGHGGGHGGGHGHH